MSTRLPSGSLWFRATLSLLFGAASLYILRVVVRRQRHSAHRVRLNSSSASESLVDAAPLLRILPLSGASPGLRRWDWETAQIIHYPPRLAILPLRFQVEGCPPAVGSAGSSTGEVPLVLNNDVQVFVAVDDWLASPGASVDAPPPNFEQYLAECPFFGDLFATREPIEVTTAPWDALGDSGTGVTFSTSVFISSKPDCQFSAITGTSTADNTIIVTIVVVSAGSNERWLLRDLADRLVVNLPQRVDPPAMHAKAARRSSIEELPTSSSLCDGPSSPTREFFTSQLCGVRFCLQSSVVFKSAVRESRLDVRPTLVYEESTRHDARSGTADRIFTVQRLAGAQQMLGVNSLDAKAPPASSSDDGSFINHHRLLDALCRAFAIGSRDSLVAVVVAGKPSYWFDHVDGSMRCRTYVLPNQNSNELVLLRCEASAAAWETVEHLGQLRRFIDLFSLTRW